MDNLRADYKAAFTFLEEQVRLLEDPAYATDRYVELHWTDARKLLELITRLLEAEEFRRKDRKRILALKETVQTSAASLYEDLQTLVDCLDIII